MRSPLWNTYVQKGGPNSRGPGLPFGDIGREHGWQPTGSARGQRLAYDRTQNFENGAIAWNAAEGAMSPNYNQHGVFLPNCRAYDINDPNYIDRLRNMIGRYALSNDFNTNLSGGNLWADNGVHPGTGTTSTQSGQATRGELIQSLLWAEGYPISGSREFSDVTGHWARPYIRTGDQLNIANGYSDGTYHPDAATTRQQFAKMITQARGWGYYIPAPNKTSSTCGSPSEGAGYYSFPDVCGGTRNNGFYKYIETVAYHNAIGGYSDGTFGPANNITRAQMSKIIDAALTNDGVPPPTNPCWGEPTYP